MLTIQASQLQVGSIIDHVEGNPNIRGTVMQVNRFGGAIANKERGSLPKTNRKEHPLPALAQARIIAQQVEECYNDSEPTSITVKIGHQNINLRADTRVVVWVPASDVMHALYGR